jgi:transcriptional regulator with XRE-family HTH domain
MSGSVRRRERVSGEDLGLRFGENLKRSRRRVGLSQEELGERAWLHRTEISYLEHGLRMPRLDTIVKLAGGLEVTPAELLVGMAWWPGRGSEPGSFELLRGTQRGGG